MVPVNMVGWLIGIEMDKHRDHLYNLIFGYNYNCNPISYIIYL